MELRVQKPLSFIIRPAQEADVPGMLEIYAPFVRESAVTFEYDVPDHETFALRLKQIGCHYPWLVAVTGNQVLAYAYATRFRERAAYQWCCETSVYVRPDCRRMGLATQLYKRLFEALRAQGMMNLYALITLPNPESVALHAHLGFEVAGTLRKSGYKHGAWHDVLLMEHFLQAHPDQPVPPDFNLKQV